MRRRRGRSLPDPSPAAPNRSGEGAPARVHGRLGSHAPSVPNPKSVTKFGGGSTTLAALLLLGIAPTIPRRRALPASPNRPRLWQRTSDPGHLEDLDHHRTAPAEGVERGGPVRPAPHAARAREQ